MNEPRAIIDIGSNTVRMVIYGGPPRAPAGLFNGKVTPRPGKGGAADGQLSAMPGDPLRTDARRLASFDVATLKETFQVRADNPLIQPIVPSVSHIFRPVSSCSAKMKRAR